MEEPARPAGTRLPLPWIALATNARAILWMLLGAACVVAMSAVIKHVSRELPVAVVFLFRMAFAIPLVLPWVAWDGFKILHTRRLKSHFARGTVGALSMWCWVFGVKYLPLTTFTAISFTRPLWTTLTAWLVLREVVGRRRGMLTLVGFAGVVMVVRPALDAQLAVLVALLGGAVSSLTLVQVKQLATTEPAARIVFYFSLFGTLYALPFAIMAWTTPSLPQLGWLALAAIAAASAQYCVARAAALGDATLITPVDFMQLPFAAIVGFALFSELPNLLTIAGSVVIVSVVFAIVHVERRRRMRPPSS
ncbi:MAG: DMT family transporter [Gemmatimonadetes bacterium]|nr:DMT family transporter [Gemmatimonadota bacterium]